MLFCYFVCINDNSNTNHDKNVKHGFILYSVLEINGMNKEKYLNFYYATP